MKSLTLRFVTVVYYLLWLTVFQKLASITFTSKLGCRLQFHFKLIDYRRILNLIWCWRIRICNKQFLCKFFWSCFLIIIIELVDIDNKFLLFRRLLFLLGSLTDSGRGCTACTVFRVTCSRSQDIWINFRRSSFARWSPLASTFILILTSPSWGWSTRWNASKFLHRMSKRTSV